MHRLLFAILARVVLMSRNPVATTRRHWEIRDSYMAKCIARATSSYGLGKDRVTRGGETL